MKNFYALSPLVLSLILVGCMSSADEDLRQWMANERAQARPRITPISEPKKFEPQDYTVSSEIDPFNPLKLTQALKRDSSQTGANAALIAPEQIRKKEPLEAFPLDSISMVGSMTKNGKPTALLKVDNLLYQVYVGQYLGQNYGRIVKINESGLQLREIVQDATGDWTERMTSLDLQEGAKK
ncbi:pilus assembly protein PilP [Acidovorax sp. DW039]|uniref:pilus assembly protein PilP n=1 Tax=Acidovorax sp. DW039 TaxID=3095606 RepID=UPI003088544D|nr:pilus assembly protein PilP [Acidovorax sp. DW039]